MVKNLLEIALILAVLKEEIRKISLLSNKQEVNKQSKLHAIVILIPKRTCSKTSLFSGKIKVNKPWSRDQ